MVGTLQVSRLRSELAEADRARAEIVAFAEVLATAAATAADFMAASSPAAESGVLLECYNVTPVHASTVAKPAALLNKGSCLHPYSLSDGYKTRLSRMGSVACEWSGPKYVAPHVTPRKHYLLIG